MASNVRTYTITIGKVFNGDVECTNPTVTIGGNSDIVINCVNATLGVYTVQVGPNDTDPCIDFIVECEECGTCPPQVITKCFCDSQEDCNDCEICSTDGFCDPLCDPDFCVDGTCHECLTDNDCDCNQVCDGNGNCVCPGGTSLNPLTGCCDECSTSADCEDCEICQTTNGVNSCVPKDCPGGVPKIDSCECVECNNSGDCDGPNECCDENNECGCCEHYIRVDGVCTWYECLIDDDCGPCEYCDNLNCTEILCTDGAVCNPDTNGCEPPCDSANLNPGFGNLDGFCVECSTLSCAGTVSECSQAEGCGCDDNGNCVQVDCSLKDCISWEVTPPVVVPGTPVSGTGVPAPSFTVAFTELGIVNMSGGDGAFLDYSITITETNGNSGSWSAEGSALGVGSSVTFNLSDPTNIQWNNVAFEVNYIGALGQTGSIVISNQNWFDPGNGYVQDLFTTPANWVVDVQGEPVLPTMSGSSYTPGSYELCPCGENTTIIGTSWTTTEGNLTLSFTPMPDGCRRVTIQGCGDGNGTVTTECAGITTTVPIPPLPYDFTGTGCCDPVTDPNCDGTPGDGFGCDTLTVITGDITLSNTNYTTADGYGLFRGVFQPDSIGYNIAQWVRAARNVCWSVTGTVREATSFIPPTLAHLFHDVEYRTGVGCLELGKTCEIKIAGCKKVEASVCFEGCDEFDVTIIDTNPTFTATTSIGNPVQLSFAWLTNTGLTGTGSVFTIPTPNTTITWVQATATLNVNGVSCTKADKIYFDKDDVPGCTDSGACNFNEDATSDDSSCVFVTPPSYVCESGFIPGVASVLPENNPVITYVGIGAPLMGAQITPGQALAPGDYTIGIRFNGVITCQSEMTVETCYTCSDGDCIVAPTNNNIGFTAGDCDSRCSCPIIISPYFLRPGALAKIYVNATGGTNLHVVSIVKSGGGSVLFSNGTFSGGNPAVTTDVCDGNYIITVADDNCTLPATIGVNGYDCADGSMAFAPDSRCAALGLGNGPCFDCGTNQVFYTLTGDECATSYTRTFWNNGKTITYGNIVSDGSTGQGAVSMGVYPGDGVYRLVISSNNVPPCVLETTILLDCVVPSTCKLDPANPAEMDIIEFDDDNIKIHAQFTQIGDGDTYTIQFIKLVGGNPITCAGAVSETILQTITGRPGYDGLNESLSNQIPRPVTRTCYKVVITKEGDESCTTEVVLSYDPNNRSVGECSLEITSPTLVSTIYDTETENVYVSWVGSNTSGDVTIKIYVAATGVCDIGIDDLVINESGHGQSGNGWFGPIPQISSNQCITVVVEDTDDPTCTDSVEGLIDGCECGVEILDTTVDPVGETLTVQFRTKCTTTGDVDFFVTGDVTTSQSIVNGSVDGQWVIDEIEIALPAYPADGGAIDLEMTDNTDGACTQTINNIVLGANCVSCAQVASLYDNSGQVTQIRDEAANLIVNSTYDLSTPSDVADLETDSQGGIVIQGGNFCASETDEVNVSASRYAGMAVNQDNSTFVVLDHALITHADWVGTKKTYFGDCGCDTGRTCDYTANLPIALLDDSITFFYGTNNPDGDYTETITWGGMTQTPSPSFLAGIEADILNILQNLTGCDFTVASVSVTYDTGTDVLTVTINDTNAAIGLMYALNSGVGITTVVDFTQSGCV